jgi:hypothetical protein
MRKSSQRRPSNPPSPAALTRHIDPISSESLKALQIVVSVNILRLTPNM